LDSLRLTFTAKAHDQYQYIWDHSTDEEKQALFALAKGTRSGTAGLDHLITRGYVTTAGSLDPCGTCFTAFVRDQCAILRLHCYPDVEKARQTTPSPKARCPISIQDEYPRARTGSHFDFRREPVQAPESRPILSNTP
jgi:hypothetical protein